jgi:hypothetical protein
MLLQPAKNQTAYLKAGMMGFQGSGKTYTATRMAAGLAKLSGKKSPKVAFFDTEKGSDFFVKYFQDQNIQFDAVKSRAFKDLIDFMKEVVAGEYDVAIVDSISHVWRELTSSYEARLRRSNGLLFQDWNRVKGEWQQFTDAFINAPIHVIVLGRAGYEYDFSEDESGKKELLKTGTKMKVEAEFGYESDLLLEMVRIKNDDGRGWINRCYVLKDRTDTMNGKEIDYPKFEDFRTVIAGLNIGGEHFGLNTDSNSQDMFESPDRSGFERKKQHDIALEELQEVLIEQKLDGTSTQAKEGRTALLKEIYGTSSKTAIEGMSTDDIRMGISKIKAKQIMANQDNNSTLVNDVPVQEEPFQEGDNSVTEEQKDRIRALGEQLKHPPAITASRIIKLNTKREADELIKDFESRLERK